MFLLSKDKLRLGKGSLSHQRMGGEGPSVSTILGPALRSKPLSWTPAPLLRESPQPSFMTIGNKLLPGI